MMKFFDMKHKHDEAHSKLSVLHNINKSLSRSMDDVRVSLNATLAEKKELEKENLKLKRTSEDLTTSAEGYKEKNASLQKINENLFKIKDDLKEELQRMKMKSEHLHLWRWTSHNA